MSKSQKRTGKRSKMKTTPPDAPPVPASPPDGPYEFNDFVRVLENDIYYARAIHKIVKYGRKGTTQEGWALDRLAEHVTFPKSDLDELSVTESEIDPSSTRCSNNTKLSMLDFARFV